MLGSRVGGAGPEYRFGRSVSAVRFGSRTFLDLGSFLRIPKLLGAAFTSSCSATFRFLYLVAPGPSRSALCRLSGLRSDTSHQAVAGTLESCPRQPGTVAVHSCGCILLAIRQ